MSLTDSDDDVEPGSGADSLLRRMALRSHGDNTLGQRTGKEAVDPGSLEAQLIEAGVTSPFNTWQFEETLKQQAAWAMERRHHEIESLSQALHGALAELQRVRAAEESRLASRVGEVTARFHQQLDALQQQYLAEVEKLKRRTMSELHKHRAQSETAIAARVRALQGQLRHERPAGLSVGGGAAVTTAAALAGRGRDVSPGAGGRLPAGTGTRMRSAPGTRVVLEAPAAAAATAKAAATAATGGGGASRRRTTDVHR